METQKVVFCRQVVTEAGLTVHHAIYYKKYEEMKEVREKKR